MNKNDAAQYLPFVQALADGKTIQLQEGDNWLDIKDTNFSFAPSEYRIKPEPREIWVNEYPNGVRGEWRETEADAWRIRANDTARQVRYREVLE